MFFKSLSGNLRYTMMFGIAVFFGGGLLSLTGLLWSIFGSGTPTARVLIGVGCTAFITWLVTMIVKSR